MIFTKNFHRKLYPEIIILSIIFLFFLQLTSNLIESIYMLDLLNTTLDEKALGLLFLLTPFLLLIFKKGLPKYTVETLAIVIIITRIITPLVEPSTKIIIAGIGVGSFMFYFPSYLLKKSSEPDAFSVKFGTGLGFAVIISIIFRVLGSTLDISMYGAFQAIGWILSALALFLIFGKVKFSETLVREQEGTEPTKEEKSPQKKLEFGKTLLLSLALISILILIYFAFSSPTVISRWTEGDYTFITISLIAMISISIGIISYQENLLSKLEIKYVWIWNLLFVLSLFFTIFVHTISFPAEPSSDPVIVNHPPPLFFQIPLFMMILLSPIVFIDFTLLTKEITVKRTSQKYLGISFGVGGILFILLVLILIFTNVWGYIEPVSNIFRNLFWLPFLIIGLFLFGGVLFIKNRREIQTFIKSKKEFRNLLGLLTIILLGTMVINYIIQPKPWEGNLSDMEIGSEDSNSYTLTVMTYNIQQGVNISGDKNYIKQLELIKEVNPDIIGLQESDTARISGGNSDIVRFFAEKLNYYSYYGPKTVTGTYGCAVLSRYPILHAETIFTYSNVDEIGTAYVQIEFLNFESDLNGVGYRTETANVYISHPAGSHEAKLAHIEAIMNHIDGKDNVISMGDFNSRPNSIYYNYSVAELKDTWVVANESTIIGSTEDFEIERRIDHIFVSNDFEVLKTQYITEPQSDHPALWTEIDIDY